MNVPKSALWLIVCVAIGCAVGIWGIKGAIEADVATKVKAALGAQQYDKAVSDYKDCVKRQLNTASGNQRAGIQKQFIILAATARRAAGQDFAKQHNTAQAKVNFKAASQEFDLARRVRNTTYIACYPPKAPSGARPRALPKAPYNNRVPGLSGRPVRHTPAKRT